MTPEMITYIWVAIIGLFATVIAALIAGYFALKGIRIRSGSQNFLEEMQGKQIAQQIIDKYEQIQLQDQEKIRALEQKVDHLQKMLENTHIKQTTITKLGEVPSVVYSSVEILDDSHVNS